MDSVIEQTRFKLRNIYGKNIQSIGRVSTSVNTRYTHIGVILHTSHKSYVTTPSKIEVNSEWELQLISRNSTYRNNTTEIIILYQIRKKSLSIFSFLRHEAPNVIGSTPPEYLPSHMLHDIHARYIEQMASFEISP